MSQARKALCVLFVAAILSCGFFAAATKSPKASAAAGINSQISFQGKVVKADGTNITDGTYNIEFKIYQDGTSTSGGTLKWTEDRLISASNGVVVTNGTFQVNLGSITALSSVDFNQNTLWLSLQVGSTSPCTVTMTFLANCGGDGEMSPFIRMTATPYALNADKVDGIDASGFVQLTPGSQQAGSINVSGNIVTAGQLQSTGGLNVGSASAVGNIALADGTANNFKATISTVALANSYTLTLPTSGVAGAQCLQSTSGSTTAATVLQFAACGGGGASLQTAYTAGSTITETAANSVTITSSTNIPTVDQFIIDNTASSGVVTANANGASIRYKGGAAAVEAAGMRLDYTPGTTSGGAWSGVRIVEAAAATTGVNSYGLKLEGGGSGAGNSYGIEVASGWDIGIDVQSGGLQLAAQADPAVPAAGNLRIYAKDIAGRVLPKWVGPAGVDTPFQANLGFNRVTLASPNGTANCSTGVSLVGTTLATAGTCTVPTLASTNLMTAVRRLVHPTGVTAGTIVYQRQAVLQAWRGNAASRGGFFYTTRFGTSVLQSGNRAFVGLADSIANPTNVDPTTSTTPGKIGMAINASTGNWNIVNNTTGSAPTVTALGASFPVDTTSLYELILYSAPNGTGIGWRVTNKSTNAQTSGTLSTNIPTNTTFVSPLMWITNNATAASASLDWAGWYLESDD